MKYTRRLSALQNTFPIDCPSLVSAEGLADPSAGTTYKSATPARSQRNATRRLSRDHTGLDGCRMSTSASIVIPPADARAAAGVA
jgi:hypothetical protein